MKDTPKLISGLRCPVCRERPTLSGKYFHKASCPYYQTSPQVEDNPAEINRRLAEEVMGWELKPNPFLKDMVIQHFVDESHIWYEVFRDSSGRRSYYRRYYEAEWNPYYNTTHAFEVVEKMALQEDEGGLGYYCRMEVLPLADAGDRYKCTFCKSDGMLGEGPGNTWQAYAATLSAAISLAVLAAKGKEK